MTVLIWGVLGYAALVVPIRPVVAPLSGVVETRLGPDRAARWAPLLLHAAVSALMVLLATLLAGPYEAAACAVGAVAGHGWPWPRAQRAWPGVPAAAGAFAILFPVETAAAILVLVAARAVRAGRASVTVALVSLPILAALRGQPAAFRFAAWAALVLIAIRRLEGVGADVAEGASPGGAAARRVILGNSGPHR